MEIAGGDAENAAFEAAEVACVDGVDAVVDGIAGGGDASDSDEGVDDGKDGEGVASDDVAGDGDRWEECFDGGQVDVGAEGAGGACEDGEVAAVQVVDHSRACWCAAAAGVVA